MVLSRRLAPWLLLAAVCLIGCGPPPKGTVSGKITVNGKPLPEGLITFLSQVGKKEVSNAKIKNGEYQTDEMLAGPAKIVIIPTLAQETIPVDKGDVRPPPKGKAKSLDVPSKYQDANTSGLEITVNAGANTFDKDLVP